MTVTKPAKDYARGCVGHRTARHCGNTRYLANLRAPGATRDVTLSRGGEGASVDVSPIQAKPFSRQRTESVTVSYTHLTLPTTPYV